MHQQNLENISKLWYWTIIMYMITFSDLCIIIIIKDFKAVTCTVKNR